MLIIFCSLGHCLVQFALITYQNKKRENLTWCRCLWNSLAGGSLSASYSMSVWFIHLIISFKDELWRNGRKTIKQPQGAHNPNTNELSELISMIKLDLDLVLVLHPPSSFSGGICLYTPKRLQIKWKRKAELEEAHTHMSLWDAWLVLFPSFLKFDRYSHDTLWNIDDVNRSFPPFHCMPGKKTI